MGMRVLLSLLLSCQLWSVDNANVAGPEQAPTVPEIQPFKTAISVLNGNDRAVRIKLVDSTCTCTTLELRDHFLLPGARTTLDVEVPSRNRSGPQAVRVSLFLSDPELEPIEVNVWWSVRASVQVDAVPPASDPLERPADRQWQDIYRYLATTRWDEPQTLRKRIRLSCPEGESPEGGLKVLGPKTQPWTCQSGSSLRRQWCAPTIARNQRSS
jgi:hypothetical protein